jgi:hypothetical protein
VDVHGVADGEIHPAVCEGYNDLAWGDGPKVETLGYPSGKGTAILDVEKRDRRRGQRWRVLASPNGLKSDVDAIADVRTDVAIAVAGIESNDRIAATGEPGCNKKQPQEVSRAREANVR